MSQEAAASAPMTMAQKAVFFDGLTFTLQAMLEVIFAMTTKAFFDWVSEDVAMTTVT